jgi:hypothetical protein
MKTSKWIERILIAIIVGGFIVTCGLAINKASAHEDLYWKHLKGSSGSIYGQAYCEMSIIKWYRNAEWTEWDYVIIVDDEWHKSRGLGIHIFQKIPECIDENGWEFKCRGDE